MTNVMTRPPERRRLGGWAGAVLGAPLSRERRRGRRLLSRRGRRRSAS